MIDRINGLFVLYYNCPKNKYHKIFFKGKTVVSLLTIIIGIFLLPKIAYLSTITPEKLIELTNTERYNAGLPALTANQLLTKAAMDKTQAIFDSQIFNHNINGRKFSSWVRDAGYNYSYVGENLAIDFVTSEGIIEAWRNSLLHNKNLLNPYYQEIGIAVIKGSFKMQETTVVAEIFGAPAQSLAVAKVVSQNFNYLSNQFINPNLQSEFLPSGQIKLENLITHSISNRLLLEDENKISLNQSQNLNYKLNKSFIQPNLFERSINFIAIYFSIIMILLLLSLYYFYFFMIFKPKFI